MNKFLLLLVTLVLSFLLSTNASATTFRYIFGQKIISGNGPVTSNFAYLLFNDASKKFTLKSNSNLSVFGTGAFIGGLAIDYSGAKVNVAGVTGGVNKIDVTNANGPTGVFDYRFKFGGGSDKLTKDESVSWLSSNYDIGKLGASKFALHVQGLSNGSSIWYAVSPVPESSTYLMMLAGLGLMGFVVSRRNQYQA